MTRTKLLAIATAGATLLVLGIGGTAQAFTFQQGDIVAGLRNGTANVFSPTGTLLNTLNTGTSSFETGSAFDSSGNLFITNFGVGSISEFDVNGNLVNTFGRGSLSQPESIVFDKAGNLYVGDAAGPIREFSSSGSLLGTFNANAQDRGTDWIDLAADQQTIRYTSEGSSVLSFNLSSNTQNANFANGLPGSNAYAQRILPDGGELVADTQSVVRLNSAGSVAQTYTVPNNLSVNLFAANLDPDGKTFLTSDYNSGELYRFDLSSGKLLQSFAGGSGGVYGLSVFGEITQGGPPPTTTVPEPSSVLSTLAFGALGAG